MENKLQKTLLVLSTIALLSLVGCTEQPTGLVIDEPDTITIGAALCLSGVCANTGKRSAQGIDMAVSEINAKGGINGAKIKIQYQDIPNGDPKAAIFAVQNLIQSNVQYVIGTTWNPGGLSTAPVACENEIILISPTLGGAEFAEECDLIFNIWAPDEESSIALGQKIYEERGRKLAIIGSTQNWELAQANSVKKGFEKAGGSVVLMQTPQASQKDFRTEITKAAALHPDAIYIQHSYSDLISQQLIELGLEIPIYTPKLDSELIRNSQGALEGATVVSQFYPTAEFEAMYEKVHHVKPDYGTDNAYDAIKLLTQAITRTNSLDVQTISNYINSMGEYDGASGKFHFDENGNAVKKFGFLIVEDGILVKK